MISLKEERLKRGLSIYRVAKDTGYSWTAIQHLEENGFPKQLSTPILEDLCSYYKINYYIFLKGIMPTETIGQRIKFVRYLTNRSLPTLGNKAFQAVLSLAERGETMLGADKAAMFAQKTGVNLNWLLLDEGHIFRGGKQV